MSWASKRQTSIVLLLISLASIPFIFIGYKIFSIPPTCGDNKKNQSEVGVDCGGPCSLVCKSQVSDLVISWKRFFLVGNGVYNVVVYVENPNAFAGTDDVRYRIRMINKDGVSMYERVGYTVIPAKRSVPIVEAGIPLGDQVPVRIEFNIENQIVWKKEAVKDNPLYVVSNTLEGATTSPKLTTQIENKDVVDYKEIEVVALLYDSSNNVIGASRTLMDKIEAGKTQYLIFTWPKPFDVEPSRIEVIPKLFK